MADPVALACPNCRSSIVLAPAELLGSCPTCAEVVRRPMSEHETATLDQPAASSVADRDADTGATQSLLAPASAAAAAGAANSPSATVHQIGRFVIRRELGEGAFGKVYEAHDPQLDRAVALKIAKLDRGDAAQRIKRFLREAKTAANLRHPHIVPLYEYGQEGDLFYIASAFIQGQTLEQFLKAQPAPDPQRAVRIVRQLAEALAYAHRQGIVHRDVKPANTMLDEHEQPLLLDFGLATRQEEAEKITHAGQVMGTPRYMAPEQARGEALAASDQYSLGVMLYEMLTGQPLFPEVKDPWLMIVHQMKTEPESPRMHNRSLSRDLETLCLKCLEKEPAKRYASCEALAEDLRHCAADEPIAARAIGRAERLWRWCRRQPATAALIAVTTLALFLGIPGVVMMYSLNEVAEARGREKDLAVELADARQYNALLNSCRQRYFTQPQGWREANFKDLKDAAQLKTGERNVVELRSELASTLCGASFTPFKELHTAAQSGMLAFHPNGTTLAIAQRRAPAFLFACSLVLVDVSTGQVLHTYSFAPKFLTAEKPDGARSIAYNRQGTRLAVGMRSGWIYCWDFAAGASKPASWDATNGGKRGIEGLSFSRDGLKLYSRSSQDLKCWDLSTGKELATHATPRGRTLALNPGGDLVAPDHGNSLLSSDTLAVRATLPAGLSRMDFHPTRPILAAEKERKLVLVDTEEKQIYRAVADAGTGFAHDEEFKYLKFHPNGSLLLSATIEAAERGIRLWEICSGRLLAQQVAGTDELFDVAVSPAGHILAAAVDKHVAIYQMHGIQEETFMAVHTGPIETFRIAPHGSFVVCAGRRHFFDPNAKFVTVYDVVRGLMGTGLRIDTGNANLSVDAHPKGWIFAAGNMPELSPVVDMAADKHHANATAPSRELVRFGAMGDILWTTEGGTLKSWKWREGKELSSWNNQVAQFLSGQGRITCLAVGSQWVLAGCLDGLTRVLATANATRIAHEWAGPGSAVRAVAISPDERLACLGYQNGKVRLVAVETGATIKELADHKDSVVSVAFSKQSGLLATGSRDQTIRLYKLQEGDAVHQLTFHLRAPVKEIEFFPPEEDYPEALRLAILLHNETAVRVRHLHRLNHQCNALGIPMVK